MFGHVPGVPVGTAFASRADLRASGVHRPMQAGICGRASEGAESIVLAGGYVDDEDWGDTILYTGAGGRGASKRQEAHQTLNGPNLALATSQRVGVPVRAVRLVDDGVERVYRYDGLYRVSDYWQETGLDGFRIWRFRLDRAEALYDWPRASAQTREPDGFGSTEAPVRASATVSRIVRDTAVTRDVKRLNQFRCQMCGHRVETPTGPYAEAAHIWPLGRPHDGPDVLANVLCLCPTHHAAFDLYGVGIKESLNLIGLPGRLAQARGHTIGAVYLRYRRDLFNAAQQAAAEAAQRAA